MDEESNRIAAAQILGWIAVAFGAGSSMLLGRDLAVHAIIVFGTAGLALVGSGAWVGRYNRGSGPLTPAAVAAAIAMVLIAVGFALLTVRGLLLEPVSPSPLRFLPIAVVIVGAILFRAGALAGQMSRGVAGAAFAAAAVAAGFVRATDTGALVLVSYVFPFAMVGCLLIADFAVGVARNQRASTTGN